MRDAIGRIENHVDVLHRDGTEILNDTAPPQPAKGACAVCLGVYEKTGRHIPINSNTLSGHSTQPAHCREPGFSWKRLSRNENGNAFSGMYDFKTYDLNGNLTFEQKGDLKAERITPD